MRPDSGVLSDSEALRISALASGGMVAPKRRVPAARSISASSIWGVFARERAVVYLLTVVVLALLGLSIGTVVTDSMSPSQSVAIATATLAAAASGLVFFVIGRSLQATKTWMVKRYQVSGLPAVRYQTAAGDYIKFEQYEDGVSANWSTNDGPTVLLSIPLSGKAPHAQFWTSEHESDELALFELAPDLRRHQSEVIRAWVETDRELVLWRMADTNAAGIAQLGVLMRSWNPKRVTELVEVSATGAVQKTLSAHLKEAREWVSDNRPVLG